MFKFLPLLPLLLLFLFAFSADARNRHVINIRWPNLYPESFTWDPKSDHFIIGSLRLQRIVSVSDAGVTSSLLSSTAIPPNSSILGVSLDPRRNHRRLLAVIHRIDPPYNALAAYDLTTSRQLFLTPLDDLVPSPSVANDVAVDFYGNAYVTDSANDVIYKVNENGVATILSQSNVFKSQSVDTTTFYHECGLNGVVYNSKGYLLVTQSNTGNLFKVDAEVGSARRVILNRKLTAADGIATRSDGVVLVVSMHKLYFVKSDDSWSEGVVFDETALEEERQASAVTVGAEDRVYVLYGHVQEAIMGNSERKEFAIVEVESGKESEGEAVWIFVLIGLGFAYFLFWRFQMKQLVHNMNKKTA